MMIITELLEQGSLESFLEVCYVHDRKASDNL